VHTWMICISVITSDVLREMSDVLAANLMLTELLFFFPNFISFQDEDG